MTMPSGGWPVAPRAAALALRAMNPERLALLQTRGLMALLVPYPSRQVEFGVRWFTEPPDVARTDLRYYIDGSLKFARCWFTARTGCAIVVVSTDGDLVAYGNARPPAWVRSAAAAEL